MKKKWFPTSIKSRITLMTITVTVFITILVSSVYFYTFQSLLTKSLIQSTEFSLQTVVLSLDKSISELINFAQWGNINSSVNSFLTSEGDPQKKLAAYNIMYVQYLSNYSTSYIMRIMIGGNDGKFIQEVKKPHKSSSKDYEKLVGADFFQSILKNMDYERMDFVLDPMTEEELILPIIRPIYNSFTSDRIGWTYIAASSELFLNAFKNYPLPSDSALILTLGEKHYQYKNGMLKELSVSYPVKDESEEYAFSKQTHIFKTSKIDGKSYTLVSYSSTIPGFTISQSLSDQEFFTQKCIYYSLLFAAGCMILMLGIFLVSYLNHIIANPISKILEKVFAVSKGDFSKDPSIEWEHELGEIGRGINKLSTDVVTLMEKRIADEKHQKELEYQILQNQINPHFLYNTLNSIKWMATIQHADGIAEMTTALSRLLKSVAKNTKEVISIEEELALLKNYVLIQEYRYGGAITITYQIEEEEILSYLIPKFTLQPIVENAIFHGIEARGGNGLITIFMHHDAERLSIEITDNGIGMSQELIQKVLKGEDEISQNDFFRKIGISNVHQRIKHTFGESYGIAIKSQIGMYTTMKIDIPCIKEEKLNGEAFNRG